MPLTLSTQPTIEPTTNSTQSAAGAISAAEQAQGLSKFHKRSQSVPTGVKREYYGELEIALDGSYANIRLDRLVLTGDNELVDRDQIRPNADDYEASPPDYDPEVNRPYDERSWTGQEDDGMGKRDVVTGFSKKSRGNLLKTVARVKSEEYSNRHLIFLTLTMPNVFDQDPKAWNSHRKVFEDRIRRKYPEISFIWRLELKQRKSGTMAGEIAPHYHLIVFNFYDVLERVKTSHNLRPKTIIKHFREWVSSSWNEVVEGDADHLAAGTQTQFIRGKRKVTAYLSKYCAKIEDDGPGQARPETEAETLERLDAAHQMELIESEPGNEPKKKGIECGRRWGVFNRGAVPWSDFVKFIVHSSSQLRVWSMFRHIAKIPEDVNWALPSISIFCDPEWLLGWLESEGINVLLNESGVYS